MSKIVTLGEIMLRLSPPGNTRFVQADTFDIHYGGAEANVAVSLCQLGHQVSFVSKLPDNAMGDAAVGSLRKSGVDCSPVLRGGERLGIYYLENGASLRPSSVIYDRAYSSFASSSADEFDFDEIFENADLFHISGITPVLSPGCAAITLKALESAKAHNVLISFDLNYRAKLWTDDIESKQAVIRKAIEYADICFGNALDAAKCSGYSEDGIDFLSSPYALSVSEEKMRNVLNHYHLKYLVTTLREIISASDNGWSAAVCTKDGLHTGKKYNLHIVDRVGGGDAFAAGFLHGILSGMDAAPALEFAIAAAAIKHTIPGDFNYIREQEVLTLMHSEGSGRVVR